MPYSFHPGVVVKHLEKQHVKGEGVFPARCVAVGWLCAALLHFKPSLFRGAVRAACAVGLARPQHSLEHPACHSSPSVCCSRLQPSMNAGGSLCCSSSKAFLSRPCLYIETQCLFTWTPIVTHRQDSYSALLKK